MAEGFVLNIPKEMLDRLQKADEKIEKLDKNSRRVGENIRLAFMEGAKGVDKFIGSLNSAQKILDGFKDRKINVGLNLDAKAIDDLKKQLSTAGVNIPVGVTGTGSNASGNNLSSLIAKIDTITQILNQILAQTTTISNKMDSRGGGTGSSTGGTRQTPYTQKQLESLNKKARTALYREELNALQRLTYAEKEKARVERENDKKNQIAHRQRMAELQQQEREIRRLAASYRNLPTSIDTKSAGGLIARSKNANTINQRLTAIRNLKNAIKDLDTTDSRYQRTVNHLNKEIRRQEQELAKLGHRMNDVSKRSQNLFNISQQLGRALSLMFSVSQIGQYISKMVNVRKEMELQQRSLQVLLQSKDKANELWNQTLDLAVKSPFRVKELVTYTKQLAAYRIESDKLFETNKMLADVSAGLGVDMQRLILAFGQVKSASFLRGTELRQFTEAGIPMLEELSKYFSEIYGKSVSVAEVFDMISKRMVTFTDVEKVFQRMTGAGGVFFNMQEELSQTTAGMISNLQDSIDLMFNEIGKKNQGLINDVIKAARNLVDNWETVGKVMKGALLILLMYKAATMDISKITKGLGANVKFLFSELKENPLEFFQTFKGNIIMTALTAIIALVGKVIAEHRKYKRAVEEVNTVHEKFRDSISDVENGFADLFSQGVGDLEEYKGKLQELVGIAQQSYNIEMDFQINNLETIEEVSRKFDELKAKILSFDELSLQFDLDFVDANDRGLEWFEDYLGKDLTQLGESQKTISKAFYDIRTNMSGVLKDYYEYQRLMQNNNNLNEKEVERLEELSGRFRNANTEIFESFKKQNYDEETSYDFFQRNVEGLREWIKEYDRLLNKYLISYHQSDLDNLNNFSAGFTRADVTDFKILLKDYDDKIKEATIELDKFYQKTEDDISLKVADLNTTDVTVIEKELSNMVYNSLKKIATEKEYNELILNEMLSQAEKYYKNNLGYELDLMPKIKTPDPIKLKQWQQTFNEEVDEILNTLTSDEDKAIFLPLKIRTDLQGVATTQDKQLATINEAIDTAQKELDRIEKQKTNLDAKLKSGEITKKQYDDLYTANIEKKKKLIEQLTQLRDLLGGDDEKSKGKDTATQRIKDQISLIRQLYEEYQKLSKEMGATTAKGNVLSRFTAYAKELGLNIDDIDFTNLQGIYNALQGLESSAESAGADAMKALTKAMGETSVELELMFYIDERNKFENQIKDMFSDYELSLELDKLNIPKNLASQLFGVDTVDLDDIKTALQNKLNDLDSADISLTQQLQDKDIDDNLKQSLLLQQKGNKQLREQTEADLRKISDMEQKELEERLKTYTKYLLNEQHERVKIRMETLRMLQEVENIEEYTPAQRQTITDKIKEDERKKLAQQTWKDFEQSPMYMQMFDDVENMGKGALESLITQMGTLKDELQSMGLPASDLKEILGAINKAEEELERRNPFKNFAKNAEIAFNRANKIRQLEEQRANQQEVYEDTKSTYDKHQDLLAQEEKKLESLNKGSDEYKKQLAWVELLRITTNNLAKSVNTIETNLSNTNNQINNINDSSNDFYEQLKNIGSITKSVVDGIFQITDAMSWLPEETQLSLERMKGLSDSAFTIASGIGSIMSGDIIGGITSLIGGVSGLVSLFMEWSSGTKEATIQIERQGRILSNLQNKYDRLNKAIDEAWDVAQIKQYNAELQKNLQQQIVAQKAIIEAQKSVKGANDYGSEQWLAVKEAEEELQNLYDTQEELQKNIYSKLTGGIMDDVLSTTESFVDAWYDAFKETGDGLKGLEENFNEMLLNLVKRQAAMKIAGRFIDEWDKALERYASDGDLSNSEIEYYANKVKNDLPALSSQLEAFFSSFDNVLGDTSGNLSGLQRGIQGITEQQADILASYLNSIKFIVSDSNSQLKALLAAQTSTSASNPIVAQLQVIAQQASAINTLLNSLTAPHPTLSGRGLKVVI